jgi:hypothetical protein
MTIGQLVEVLPPPAAPAGDPGAVAAAEAALGTALPPDYRELVARYGAGRIAGFLWVFQPGGVPDTIDLAAQAQAQREDLAALAAGGEPLPFPLFPDPGGLLAAGMTDNGDALFWRTGGAPETWPVVVHEARGPLWWTHDGDLTGFLAGVLSGAVRCPVFPRDFPGERPGFEPIGDMA